MPIIQQATIEDRKRLLELFPLANLRQEWPTIKGLKEEICYSVAADATQPQIDKVTKFINENLSCCKQHVYIFSRDASATLPTTVPHGEKILEEPGVRSLYAIRVSYNIVLRDPLEDGVLEFLWPVRIELTPQYFIARFVVLEKNPSSYFDRPVYVGGKTVDEKAVLSEITASGLLSPADLNKGIKKLWADGLIDSTRTKYKTSISTASEAMDEERGIKEFNPELYAAVQAAPLYTTVFQIPEDKSSVCTFSTDPSNGIIGFTRYSEKKGDTDIVIEQILTNN